MLNIVYNRRFGICNFLQNCIYNMNNNISFFKSMKLTQSVGGIVKIYRYFIFHQQKKYVIGLILIALIGGASPSIDSLFLQKITDSIETYSNADILPADFVRLLIKWVFIYALFWEFNNLIWRFYDYCYLKAMPRIMAHIISEFYNYVQYHSHQFFQGNLAGDISSRITEAAKSMEMIFAYANETFVRKIATLVFAVVSLYLVHPIVALIFTLWLSVFIGISLYFSKTINIYSRALSKNKALMVGKIVDAITNISAVRMFSSHKLEQNYLKTYTKKVIASDQKLQWFMLKLRYLLGLSSSIMIGFMIYYIITLRGSGQISIGQSVLIISLCLAVFSDIWDLTQQFGDLFEHIGSFNQSLTLIEEYKVKDIPGAKALEVKSPSIEFRNVTFDFPDRTNMFSNQSLMILPKQKVGLAGFSGSGKSTFASLIYRLRDISSGTILIDGQDISQLSQDSLHNNISVIPQEPILFHRSVRENICYGNPNASEQEMMKAAKSAHIHDLIMSLPKGYDTICGERGNNFSGGQRQRIIIARAFLKNASILILDEATSALDSRTENLIQESLRKLMQDKTVIVIAHRLSTLLNMDRILVFNKGVIVEDGTHEELIKKGEIYKLLWSNYKTI